MALICEHIWTRFQVRIHSEESESYTPPHNFRRRENNFLLELLIRVSVNGGNRRLRWAISLDVPFLHLRFALEALLGWAGSFQPADRSSRETL